jgi:TP901 family phage tail tape measure protein
MATEEQTNAQIVVSADTTQYQQSVQAATQETSKLNEAVGSLGRSLDGITSKIGKRLIFGGGAALVAIAAAAKTAADYDKQLFALKGTAAYAGESVDKLGKSITDISKKFPVARGEVIGLYESFTKLGQKAPAELKKLSESAILLGGATGENVNALATSLGELNRSFGTLNSTQFERFGSALTNVSKLSGVSATGIASFAQSLAPISKAAGITENQVLGISAAFSAAGADGFAASNTFNTIVADITRQIQYGSPDIAKYANLLGKTSKEFKSLGTTEGVTQLFEYISKQGPASIKILDQLGIDGIRASKAISAVAQQGGIRKYINGAEAGYDNPDKMKEIGAKAFDNLNTSVDGIKKSFQEIGEAIGSSFLPAVAAVAKVIDKILQPIASIVRLLFDNPIAKAFASAATAIAVAVTVLGTFLTAQKALNAIAAVGFVAKSTPIQSLIGGFREGQATAAGLPFVPRNATEAAGASGALAETRRYSGVPFWRLGNAAGGASEPGPISAAGVARRVLVGTTNLATAGVNTFGTRFYNDSAVDGALRNGEPGGGDRVQRPPLPFTQGLRNGLNVARSNAGSFISSATDGATTSVVSTASRVANTAGSVSKNAATAANTYTGIAKNAAVGVEKSASALATEADLLKTRAATAAATADLQKAKAAGVFTAEMGKDQLRITATSNEASAALLRLAGASAKAAGAQLAGAGKNVATLGSTLGAFGLNNPYLVGAAAAFAGFQTYKNMEKAKEATTDPEKLFGLTKYDQALGTSSKSVFSFTDTLDKTRASIESVKGIEQKYQESKTVTNLDVVSSNKQKDYTNAQVKELKSADQAKAFLSSLGNITPEELALIKLDLLKNKDLGGAKGVESILSSYSPNKTFNDYVKNISVGENLNAAYTAQAERNVFKRGFLSGEARTSIDAGFGGIDTGATAIENQFGAQAATAYRQQSYRDAFGAITANQGTAGKNNASGGKSTVTDAALKQFASSIGIKSGELRTNVIGGEGGSLFADNAKTPEELARILLEANKDNAEVTDKLVAAGLGTVDAQGKVTVTTGADLQKNLQKALLGSDVGSFDSTLAKTSIGKTLLGDKNIQTGQYDNKNAALSAYQDASLNPENIRNLSSAILTAGGFNQSTNDTTKIQSSLIELANGINDTTNATYKFALALRDAVVQIASLRLTGTSSSSTQQGARLNNFTQAAYNQNDPNAFLTFQTNAEQEAANLRLMFINQIKQYEAYNRARANSEADFQKSVTRAKKSFDLSLARQDEDYQLSKDRQEEDYNLQRKYSIEDFNRARARAEEDFQKGQARAIEDFNKSRIRSMRDYNKQLARMVEDSASSMYDPYQRITARVTWDGRNLIANMQEQARKIREQVANIEKLKQAGLSQQAIDQLGLADASNAQQTASLASQVGADPTLAAGLNQAAGSKQASAQELLINDSNKTYRRMRDDFNQSLADSAADFKKAMERQQADYSLALTRQDSDFNRGLERGSRAFNKARERSDADFAKNRERAITDQRLALAQQRTDYLTALARNKIEFDAANEEIFGSLETLAARSGRAIKASNTNTKNAVIANNDAMVKNTQKAIQQVQAFQDVNTWNSDPKNAAFGQKVVWLPGPGGGTKGGSWYYPPGYSGGRLNRDRNGNPLDDNGRGMAKGGIMTNRQRVDFAEDGPELAIPLNQQGINFLKSYITQSVSKDAIKQMMVGSYGSPVEFKGQGNVYNDNSTQVNGPITVVSNDPNDMANKIAAKARYNRLTSRK